MEIIILDQNFKSISIIDNFASTIWTDRYNTPGDFEIRISMGNSIVKDLCHDYYLWTNDSEHQMIIEDLVIETDSEEGNYLNVTGRSLESMLDRRIVWTQTILNGNLQNGVQQLLNENLINPTNADRKIDNFIFLASEDERVTSLTLEAQYTGDNLLTVINSICETNDIGFKVYLNDENKFVFTLYKGQDRSYDQLVNPYVIFSTNFDNIIDSEYLESKTKYKNVTLVAGEDKGTARKTVVVGEGYGIDRRELYTDARDISTTNGNTTLTDAQYTSQLQQRGKENLAKNILIKTFDGEFETQKMFSYRKDFNMGDIVQVVSEYGRETRSQIMEMIISQDLSGYTTYPTFKILDNETGEESEVS